VRVIVSGGFTAERIAAFEAIGVPVDSYAVGSSLLKGGADYTADVVLREGVPCAKVGRVHRPSTRLQPVDLTVHGGAEAPVQPGTRERAAVAPRPFPGVVETD
jgi:nicotinic acid phosphoribosyltransferase